MDKSHLISILRTFTKKEWRELGKWLASPAHNQRQDVVLLYEYLSENVRIHSADQLTKPIIFQYIFPNEPYNDARFRQTAHFFRKTLDDFLIYQEFRTDETYAKIALARFFRKRRLDKPFQKNKKQIEQTQEQHPFRNAHYLRNEYLLQQEQYAYISIQKKRNVNLNLQEASDALDITFIADKLRQGCLMLAHQKVYKVDYQTGLLDGILEYIENNNLRSIPAVAVYYYVYKANIDKENESHFQNLKTEIGKNKFLFPEDEIRDIYLMAINYCINKINSGEPHFGREVFELYRTGFENQILVENNTISGWSFHNAISAGIKLKEYKWIESFINEFQVYLPETHKGSINFNLARLHYHKKEYDKAMSFINTSEFDDILTNLDAKTLLMKMFYEQDELDALESLLESMRNYLVRKKVMGYHKANYKNIIRYTKKLVKVNPYNSKQKEKLHKEILEASPLTQREWILTQFNRL